MEKITVKFSTQTADVVGVKTDKSGNEMINKRTGETMPEYDMVTLNRTIDIDALTEKQVADCVEYCMVIKCRSYEDHKSLTSEQVTQLDNTEIPVKEILESKRGKRETVKTATDDSLLAELKRRGFNVA